MRSYRKKFLVSPWAALFLFILVFGGFLYPRDSSASISSIIRAFVTINPLKVEISVPEEVRASRVFIIKARVENKGKERVEMVKAKIFLPEELELIRKNEEQNIGMLPPKIKKFISWQAKGEKTGHYVVSVRAWGELKENLIAAEDSAVVKIKEERPPGWWRKRFDFLRRFFDFFSKA